MRCVLVKVVGTQMAVVL